MKQTAIVKCKSRFYLICECGKFSRVLRTENKIDKNYDHEVDPIIITLKKSGSSIFSHATLMPRSPPR